MLMYQEIIKCVDGIDFISFLFCSCFIFFVFNFVVKSQVFFIWGYFLQMKFSYVWIIREFLFDIQLFVFKKDIFEILGNCFVWVYFVYRDLSLQFLE